MKKMLSLCLAAMGLFVGTIYGADAMPAGTQAQTQWDGAQDTTSNMTQNPSYNDGQGQGSYGRGAYGQQDYSRGSYGQQDYSRGAYGQQDYSRGAYGQQDYSRGSYGQQDYSQGAYGQQDYSQGAYGQGSYGQVQGQDYNNDGHADSAESGYYGQEVCCGKPFEHACGDTYQLYCTYKPCYYNEWRTVCEPQCYQKKCCKYVAKEYDKCCVKYVPQYYTQKCCKYEPCYFYTTETREVSKKVCDRKCKYVPQYYYKHICTPAPQACCP